MIKWIFKINFPLKLNNPTSQLTMDSLAKTYDPNIFEKKISAQWEYNQAFLANASSNKPSFTISMPPPNATGQLHVGHAVMLVLEDIFVRWKRMEGYETLWLPGTDHAAIATENVVLQKIKDQEGISDPRKILGREEILRRIEEYVKEFTSKKAAGKRGYLLDLGLVPLENLKDAVSKVE